MKGNSLGPACGRAPNSHQSILITGKVVIVVTHVNNRKVLFAMVVSQLSDLYVRVSATFAFPV